MKINEASIDRGIRIVIGAVLIALAVTGRFAPWGWLGVVPLAAGLVGFCPLYRLVGIDTCRPGRA